MIPSRRDIPSVVGIAAVAVDALVLLRSIAWVAELDGFGIRTRVALTADRVDSAAALVLVLAALGLAVTGRRSRAVGGLGIGFGGLTVVGVAITTFWWDEEVPLDQALGYAVGRLGTIGLLGLAAWIVLGPWSAPADVEAVELP